VLVWLGVTPHSFLKTEDRDSPEGQTA
jgi:hypothetical protein